ncbi:hypothetical protein MLD38_032727 [Melastoma candidum]|uniref:Uncharacterized protein n=1 Tax=Melastoma candidum TaxID=119954 RepID=A0ACB9M6J0_9MYRT|nr:hypothetical protein MLD38_032727 [Melastoma candidum]
MNKSASRRSDSFHSVDSHPSPSPSPSPPLPLVFLPPPPPSAFRAPSRKTAPPDRLRLASLACRVSQAVLCLVSLSVMASDRTRGWSGDSFFHYREYRFCLSVNVIGFLYSAFQLCDLAYHAIASKHVVAERIRPQFEFFMDQILAYLLMSGASAGATRVDDWELNWGEDEFTKMASASVGMAFAAFVSYALSCLVSGYNLCTRGFAGPTPTGQGINNA